MLYFTDKNHGNRIDVYEAMIYRNTDLFKDQ